MSLKKIKAIKEAHKPENTHELKAFIGMVNYYAKFCGFLTNALEPLYLLLQQDVKWHWGKEQNTAFEAVMRTRVTKGMRISNYYGNFFIRGTDLMALPNVNSDSVFGLGCSIVAN